MTVSDATGGSAMMKKWGVRTLIVLLLLGISTSVGFAQSGLVISVTAALSCDEAVFEVGVTGGSAPYTLTWDFGDGETLVEEGITDLPHFTNHAYLMQGDYGWTLTVVSGEQEGEASGTVSVDGPSVTLNSTPFPPLLYLDAGSASVEFSALVEGGSSPYSYEWDLDGDGTPDPGITGNGATATYNAAGKYSASVTVTDACGMWASDSLPVVVTDAEAEACHPTAQKIADAVNTLFPLQAETLYTCEDIFDMFSGGLTGSQVGFGNLWHPYQLALAMEELTWEEIRDWHLEGSGWGLLLQLDRFADALEEIGLVDLIARVQNGETTIGDIRAAVRAVTRYEADFEDALARMAAGASPGSLGQFYRLAQELGVSSDALDAYLAEGFSLSELGHAARSAERFGVEFGEVLAAVGAGHSWGEVGQAYRLADETVSAADILAIGVREYRQQLRDQARAERSADKDARTAAQIAERYGVPESDVWSVFEGCGMDWSCVRAHFRDLQREAHGNGKGKDK
jgi:hypothetical protein